MNAFDLFKREILRPLVTLAIPGGLAISPLIYLFFLLIPRTRVFWDEHQTSFILIFVVISLAVGLILEDIGSRINDIYYWFIPDSNEIWHKYLAKAREDAKSQNGERYLESIVLRMKFEFGTIAALLLFVIPGLLLIFEINTKLDYFTQIESWETGIIIFVLALTSYLILEGYSSLITLHNIRTVLVNEKPLELSSNSSVSLQAGQRVELSDHGRVKLDTNVEVNLSNLSINFKPDREIIIEKDQKVELLNAVNVTLEDNSIKEIKPQKVTILGQDIVAIVNQATSNQYPIKYDIKSVEAFLTTVIAVSVISFLFSLIIDHLPIQNVLVIDQPVYNTEFKVDESIAIKAHSTAEINMIQVSVDNNFSDSILIPSNTPGSSDGKIWISKFQVSDPGRHTVTFNGCKNNFPCEAIVSSSITLNIEAEQAEK